MIRRFLVERVPEDNPDAPKTVELEGVVMSDDNNTTVLRWVDGEPRSTSTFQSYEHAMSVYPSH